MTIAAEVRSLSSKAGRGLAMCACMEGFACCGCTCVFKGAVGGTVNIGLFHPGNLYPFQSLDLLKSWSFSHLLQGTYHNFGTLLGGVVGSEVTGMPKFSHCQPRDHYYWLPLALPKLKKQDSEKGHGAGRLWAGQLCGGPQCSQASCLRVTRAPVRDSDPWGVSTAIKVL